MNKFIMSFICIGLLTGSMASAVMSPKRLWQCATAPKENNCSDNEKKTARGWLIGGSIAVLAATLIALGIIRGPQAVRDAKIQAIDKEIADIGIQKGRAPGENVTPAQFAALVSRENELRQKRNELTSKN